MLTLQNVKFEMSEYNNMTFVTLKLQNQWLYFGANYVL